MKRIDVNETRLCLETFPPKYDKYFLYDKNEIKVRLVTLEMKSKYIISVDLHFDLTSYFYIYQNLNIISD